MTRFNMLGQLINRLRRLGATPSVTWSFEQAYTRPR